jgi:NADH-quinone oxidoreductase subunit L
MPITWITSLIGSLALIGTPFLAGFYSKDSIIEAVKYSDIPGAGFAYFAVLAGVFVTAFYSFRMYFLVFHGEERFGKDDHGHGHDDHGDDHHHGLAPGQKPHETPWVVTLPLVLLAIPSVIIGYIDVGPMLASDYFKGAIYIDQAAHPALSQFLEHFHGAAAMGLHAFYAGLLSGARRCLAVMVLLHEAAGHSGRHPASLLRHQYRAGKQVLLRQDQRLRLIAGGARVLGKALWRGGDVGLIDGLIVNGSAKVVGGYLPSPACSRPATSITTRSP